jgi:hypothetical protein
VSVYAADMNIPGSSDISKMMRAVLADRFGLQVHREARESGVLVLKIGKGPLKLKPDASPEPEYSPRRDRAEMRGVSMARLAGMLEEHYRRSVVDGRTRTRPHVQLTPAGVVNPRIMDLSLTRRARRSFLEPGVLSVNGRRVEYRAEWPIFGHSLSLSC